MFLAFCIVATPFVFAGWLIHRIFEHRARMGALASAPMMPALPLPDDAERRLANLEAIVAGLDFELAAKLREAERLRADGRAA